jgi:beta-lactamase class D
MRAAQGISDKSPRRPMVIVALISASLGIVEHSTATSVDQHDRRTGSCFILHEIGVGRIRRNPSSTCDVRVTPQSTFKIPHALAALDAGVVSEDELIKYDGHAVEWPHWRQDHALASALRYSVVWYFQELARRLGPERERRYLERFEYGNKDSSGGLTTFWLGRTLTISPDEQERFLLDLFSGRLQVKDGVADTVRRLLVQPTGHVTNASGVLEFASPWPAGAVVSAKTGSGPTGDGRAVRWLIGHVRRGQKAWVFVSNVVGLPDLSATAAIDQARQALILAGILRTIR